MCLINLFIFSQCIKSEILACNRGNRCHIYKRFSLIETYIWRLAEIKWSENADSSIILYCQARIESCPLHYLKVLYIFLPSRLHVDYFTLCGAQETVVTNRGTNGKKKKIIKQWRHHREMNSAFSLLSWKLWRHLNITIYCPRSRECHLSWKERSSEQINKMNTSIQTLSVCVTALNKVVIENLGRN